MLPLLPPSFFLRLPSLPLSWMWNVPHVAKPKLLHHSKEGGNDKKRRVCVDFKKGKEAAGQPVVLELLASPPEPDPARLRSLFPPETLLPGSRVHWWLLRLSMLVRLVSPSWSPSARVCFR